MPAGWREPAASRPVLPEYGLRDASAVFAVRPRVVFGFIENAADFAGAATSWSFE